MRALMVRGRNANLIIASRDLLLSRFVIGTTSTPTDGRRLGLSDASKRAQRNAGLTTPLLGQVNGQRRVTDVQRYRRTKGARDRAQHLLCSELLPTRRVSVAVKVS